MTNLTLLGADDMPLTSDDVWTADITDLAAHVSEQPFWYLLTEGEAAALDWIGDRYTVSKVLRDNLGFNEAAKGQVFIEPEEIRDALSIDGVDRVPCLSEDTALQRIIRAIGPSPFGPEEGEEVCDG